MDSRLSLTIEKNYGKLAKAIVEQAVTDYMFAVRDKDTGRQIEVERFFKSEWYRQLMPDHAYPPEMIAVMLADLKHRIERWITLAEWAIELREVSHIQAKPLYEDNILWKCPICGGSVVSEYRAVKSSYRHKWKKYGVTVTCTGCHMVVGHPEDKWVKKEDGKWELVSYC